MAADSHISSSAGSSVPPPNRNRIAALVGFVTGLVAYGSASGISALFGVENPFVAVGSAAIDFAPPGVKALVIGAFGTGDKTFLFALLAVVIVVIAVLIGVLQVRVAPFGTVLLAFVGLVAATATASRAGAGPFDAFPSLAGVVLGWFVLRALIHRLDRWRSADESIVPRTRAAIAASNRVGLERRGFLRLAVIAGAGSLLVAAGSGLGAMASNAAAVVRAKIKLPRPVSPAPIIPADAELHIAGLSPYIVPNAEFYRIDTALQVPNVDAEKWKLRVTGMVEKEVELTFAELLDLPLKERIITLTCVSQEIGGNLVGNASWLGFPIRDVLARAKPKTGADMVLSTSIDGFTASSPLAVLQDPNTDALLAVGMNGEPLPPEHGFPVRMVVPGLYGYVSATKWVVELKVTTYAKEEGYWTPRGYSAKAPVKLSSRIDTPRDGYSVAAGKVIVAGVAWHQHVGIRGVEVRVDDDPWQPATLARVVTVDAWLQWSMPWQARKGDHTIAVRAIDARGEVQSSRFVDVVPNGATGLHTIRVRVN